MYAKDRIPSGTLPNRRREGTEATGKTVDIQRLIADLNLPRLVARAISAVLPPIANSTSIGDIATNTTHVMLSVSAEMASAWITGLVLGP